MEAPTNVSRHEALEHHVRAICQVSLARAQQLLEAASGSVERAIDIHFSSTTTTTTNATARSLMVAVEATTGNSDNNNNNNNNVPEVPRDDRAITPPSMNERKRLATTHAAKVKTRPLLSLAAKSTPSKQRKIDSFFNSTTSPAKNDKVDATTTTTSTCSAKHVKPPATASSELASRQNDGEDSHLQMNRGDSVDMGDDPRLEFAALAQVFAEMCATTKRTIKLNALKTLFVQVIQALGGIHERTPRDADSQILTCTIDLVLGKISTKQTGSNNAVSLQVSGAAVSTAIQTITGLSRTQMREGYRKVGDLGDVAANNFIARPLQQYFVVKTPKTTRARTAQQVHDLLRSVATVQQGKGSQVLRQNLILKLLRGSKDGEELRFLVRILLGNMRVGATIKTVLAGLVCAVDEIGGRDAKEGADASTTKKEDLGQTLQQIFYLCPRIDEIAHALLCGGLACARERCSMVVGSPVHPMLADPAHSLQQVNTFMTSNGDGGHAFEAVAEWKYDGIRCQAHFDGKATTLFSRHLLDNTEQYPDAVDYLLKATEPSVKSFIIDAEIVGVSWSDTECRLLPFQDLSTRRGTKQTSTVQIRIFAFDLLFLNGVSLIERPLSERQAVLRQNFKETVGFAFASSITIPRYDETLIHNFLEEAIQGGAEGLMIKLTGNTEVASRLTGSTEVASSKTFGYESGTRSQLWLKLKRDYVSGFADTIDVVPIGAWHGNGRKAKKGFLSPILLAVYDEDEGVFRSVSRCMSFTDEMYEAMKGFYFKGTPYPAGVGIDNILQLDDKDTEHLVSNEEQGEDEKIEEEVDQDGGELGAGGEEDGGVYERVNCFPGRPSTGVIVTHESPMIWFKPSEVWEVAFADLSISRAHTAGAGLVDDPEGRGISLRFPRFKRRRPDKSIEQATTTAQMAQLFYQQSKVQQLHT